MKKKRLTAEQRKLSIMEATIRVVARLNYESATTVLIAKEAKINPALIYHHFESKLDLLLAMLDHIHQFLSDEYKSNPAINGQAPGTSRLQAITIQYHFNLQKELPMRICLLKAIAAIDSGIREKAWEIIKLDHDFTRSYLEQDYHNEPGDKYLDIDTMAWWVLASNLLFVSLSLVHKVDQIKIEKILKWNQDFEKMFFPSE